MFDFTLRTQPLTLEESFHLCRRATLRPTYSLAAGLVGKTPAEAVASLMTPGPEPATLSWETDTKFTYDFQESSVRWYEMQRWWVKHVMNTTSLTERMVSLWQNTFTSDYITVYFGQYMVKQYRLFRSTPYDVKNIALNIIGDPGMLIYLNGYGSIKGNPNENFAREWFELFTLGIGNYTEHDIVEAARAFTGWTIQGLNGTYNKQLHDVDEKVILGAKGEWDYKDVHRITFEQEACARFYAKKLYNTFVFAAPDENDIHELAQRIISNNFNLKPVMQVLLSTNGFYDAQVRGSLIKSPIEMIVSLSSMIGITQMHPDHAIAAMRKLNMEPFYPPTVEGWKGHHHWINSSTFPLRKRWCENVLKGWDTISNADIRNEMGVAVKPDLVAFAKSFPDANDARKIVRNIATALLPISITEQQHGVLVDIMLAGAPEYEWGIDKPSSVSRLQLLLGAIVRMPEFQLM